MPECQNHPRSDPSRPERDTRVCDYVRYIHPPHTTHRPKTLRKSDTQWPRTVAHARVHALAVACMRLLSRACACCRVHAFAAACMRLLPHAAGRGAGLRCGQTLPHGRALACCSSSRARCLARRRFFSSAAAVPPASGISSWLTVECTFTTHVGAPSTVISGRGSCHFVRPTARVR